MTANTTSAVELDYARLDEIVERFARRRAEVERLEAAAREMRAALERDHAALLAAIAR
jgi:hypothetical protein